MTQVRATKRWSDRASEYFAATADRLPSPLLERALGVVGSGDALEVGSGAGVDARRLVAAGFHVTAVDIEPEAARYVCGLPAAKLRFVRADVAELPLLSYDLISAQYTLPFIGRSGVARLLPRLVDALRPGGVLAAQFFGPSHGWNRRGSPLAFHHRADVVAMISGLDVLVLDEERRTEPSVADGERVEWHTFQVLASKPRPRVSLSDVLRYRNAQVIGRFVAQHERPVAEARQLFRELLKLLWLSNRVGAVSLYPFQQPLDEMWHTFVLDTQAYERFCRRYFGTLVHHAPGRIGPRPRRVRVERHRAALTRQIELVQRHLGEATARLWYETWPARYPAGMVDGRSTRSRT